MKILNRNHLKIIALITMLIDHIGVILFPEMQIFKIIGRISFPIFAFFVAEGWHYTKNRTKYVLTIAIFALITQPIYALIMNSSQLNILFTFLFAIALMYLIDKCDSMNIEHIVYLIVYLIVITFTSLLGIIDYDLLGILLPTIFYIFRNSNLKYAVSIGIIIIFSVIFSTIQLYSLIAILLLVLYNGEKGKTNLKYTFYAFYPLHIILLHLIDLII